jgi:DNA-3-methyladenine glycosylase I
MRAYHDDEWGVPSRDDRHLFEMLTLEGAQAGLSWATILNRRDGYRRAFASFDPAKVAAFDDRRLEQLREDTGIIRNRLKIYGTRTNARAFLQYRANSGPSPRTCGTGSRGPGSSITPALSPTCVPRLSCPTASARI